jgi:hypothetical protein
MLNSPPGQFSIAPPVFCVIDSRRVNSGAQILDDRDALFGRRQ